MRFSARQAKQGRTNDRIADDAPEHCGFAGRDARRHCHGHLTKFRAQARVCLFGLYYRPAVGTTTLAKVQGWLHMIGAILFPAGVAVLLLKGIRLSLLPDGLGGNAASASPCHFLSSSVA
jgi:hypothetical protein